MSGELRPAPSSLRPRPRPATSAPTPPRPASSAAPRVAKPRRPAPPPCPGELRAFPSCHARRAPPRSVPPASTSAPTSSAPAGPAASTSATARARLLVADAAGAAPPMPRADGSATAPCVLVRGRRGRRLPHPCSPVPAHGRRGRRRPPPLMHARARPSSVADAADRMEARPRSSPRARPHPLAVGARPRPPPRPSFAATLEARPRRQAVCAAPFDAAGVAASSQRALPRSTLPARLQARRGRGACFASGDFRHM
nr:formin-like protein 5 [Lolium perenne]